jgi:Sec7-like guanine-nucleotide exchange factor
MTEQDESENKDERPTALRAGGVDQLGESPDARQQVRNRMFKQEMKKAADKFNLKAKNGLKYLMEHGHIPSEVGDEQAKGIAKFLRNTPTLSPTAVGAFLGGEHALNGQVRAAYLDLIDFSN